MIRFVLEENMPGMTGSGNFRTTPHDNNRENNNRVTETNRREHREPEQRSPSHVRVIVNNGEPIEKVIRKFKKLCEKAGIKKEIKARRYYEKPSDARRREIRKKERNRRKAERKTTEQRRYSKTKSAKEEMA